jgi:xanthine/uracil permease
MSQQIPQDVFYTPDANNSWISTFRQGVANVPIIGGVVASFIGPSLTANYVKNIEGDVIDTRSGWTSEHRLMASSLVLIAILIYLRRKK